jgi:hypothetical protein
VTYILSFGDSQDLTLEAVVPTDFLGNPIPGSYFTFDDIYASASYTITASPLPEPGAYGFLVGSIMAALIAVRIYMANRRDPESRNK